MSLLSSVITNEQNFTLVLSYLKKLMKHSFSMDVLHELLISYQGPLNPTDVFQPYPLYVIQACVYNSLT